MAANTSPFASPALLAAIRSGAKQPRPAAPAAPAATLSSGMNANTKQALDYLASLFRPETNNPALAPLTPQQIQGQATRYVNNTIDPQISALTTANHAATSGGVGSIEGATANYRRALTPIAGIETAIGQQAAHEGETETSALAAYLKGAGAADQGIVNGKIAAAGIDPTLQATNYGAGSAGIVAGSGLAHVLQSNTEGKNAAQFAAALPGIAGLAGQQAENQFRGAQFGDLRDKINTLEGQVPGLTQTILQNLTGNETTKAQARNAGVEARGQALGSYLANSQDDATQLALGELGFGKAALSAGSKPPKTTGTPSTGVWQYDPTTGTWTQAVVPQGPTPTAVARTKAAQAAAAARTTAAHAKAVHTAEQSADSKVRTIITSSLKAASKALSAASSGPFATAGKGGKPHVNSVAYNRAVNEAVTAAQTILGPYMTHDEIVQFVQKRALEAGFAPAPVIADGGDGSIAKFITTPGVLSGLAH